MVDWESFYRKFASDLVLPNQMKSCKNHSTLDQLCDLNVHSKPSYPRRCSIICTIGLNTRDCATIEKLIEAGMNIARLNCTYFDHASLLETIQNIRSAVDSINHRTGLDYSVAIAIETTGPEIRIGKLEGGLEIMLKAGDSIKLTVDKAYLEKGNASCIYIDYDNILKVIQPENMIYLDDGFIALMVTGTQGSSLICSVEKGGRLGNKVNCFIPGVPIDLPFIAAKDVADIEFAIEHDLDFIIVTGPRNGQEIKDARKMFGDRLGCIKIVSKIDNQQAYANVDEIIAESDGILIYRSSLCVELPIEKVFLVQKSIIAKCNLRGKSVISGKEFLTSMVKSIRPTRAEVLDVANVIIDGADAILLADETSAGCYPVECVKYLNYIAKEAEACICYDKLTEEVNSTIPTPWTARDSIASSAIQASVRCMASAIIALSVSGHTASSLSRFYPRCPVILVGNCKCVIRQCLLLKSMWPIYFPDEDRLHRIKMKWSDRVKLRTEYGIAYGKAKGFIKSGDPVIILSGDELGETNTMAIHYITDIVTPIFF